MENYYHAADIDYYEIFNIEERVHARNSIGEADNAAGSGEGEDSNDSSDFDDFDSDDD